MMHIPYLMPGGLRHQSTTCGRHRVYNKLHHLHHMNHTRHDLSLRSHRLQVLATRRLLGHGRNLKISNRTSLGSAAKGPVPSVAPCSCIDCCSSGAARVQKSEAGDRLGASLDGRPNAPRIVACPWRYLRGALQVRSRLPHPFFRSVC